MFQSGIPNFVNKHIIHTLKILKIGTHKIISAIVLIKPEYLDLQCSNVAKVCKSCGKQYRPRSDCYFRKMFISQIPQYFLLKNCEKLLHCKSFSHFFNKYQCIFVIKL